jgi:hypothetical protein
MSLTPLHNIINRFYKYGIPYAAGLTDWDFWDGVRLFGIASNGAM